ncbi:MAG: sulfurtransferase TusA family protein [Gemmatimonadetes bacterium]|nr:sulfurtransferase TusA family protein [Gemmatimonadota bacterium]
MTLDTFGLLCPVPIMKTASAIREIAVGEVLEVLADDPQILEVMAAWCAGDGRALRGSIEEGEEYRLFVKKVK